MSETDPITPAPPPPGERSVAEAAPTGDAGEGRRHGERRRRLLKGLLGAAAGAAVPAVLTLRNGARAATASNLSCIYGMPTSHLDPYTGPLTERCYNAATPADRLYRVERGTFGGGGDTSTAGVLTGGDDVGTDLCVVYSDESGTIKVTTGTPWGEGEANHHILSTSCWNSVMLPEGGP